MSMVKRYYSGQTMTELSEVYYLSEKRFKESYMNLRYMMRSSLKRESGNIWSENARIALSVPIFALYV